MCAAVARQYIVLVNITYNILVITRHGTPLLDIVAWPATSQLCAGCGARLRTLSLVDYGVPAEILKSVHLFFTNVSEHADGRHRAAFAEAA